MESIDSQLVVGHLKGGRMDTLEGFIAAWLAENKAKRQTLADSTGCSLVTFNRRISGENDMTIGFARELAKAMSVPVDEVYRLAP